MNFSDELIAKLQAFDSPVSKCILENYSNPVDDLAGTWTVEGTKIRWDRPNREPIHRSTRWFYSKMANNGVIKEEFSPFDKELFCANLLLSKDIRFELLYDPGRIFRNITDNRLSFARNDEAVERYAKFYDSCVVCRMLLLYDGDDLVGRAPIFDNIELYFDGVKKIISFIDSVDTESDTGRWIMYAKAKELGVNLCNHLGFYEILSMPKDPEIKGVFEKLFLGSIKKRPDLCLPVTIPEGYTGGFPYMSLFDKVGVSLWEPFRLVLCPDTPPAGFRYIGWVDSGSVVNIADMGCPRCWNENYYQDEPCPGCGYQLKEVDTPFGKVLDSEGMVDSEYGVIPKEYLNEDGTLSPKTKLYLRLFSTVANWRNK